MNLGTRLNTALATALLLPEGGTVDPTKDQISLGSGGHGTHGERGRAPSGTSRPMVEQWAERFAHMLDAFERDIEAVKRGQPAVEFRGRKGAVGLRKRINEYEGRDPVWVAFIEGCSTEVVRKARKEAGLHMVTGVPLERNERPLTAPVKHTLSMEEQ